jgi:hypothetical protein
MGGIDVQKRKAFFWFFFFWLTVMRVVQVDTFRDYRLGGNWNWGIMDVRSIGRGGAGREREVLGARIVDFASGW